MKIFRLAFLTIALFALISCAKESPELPDQPKPKPPVEQIAEWLKTLPGVLSVEELKVTNNAYKKHFLIIFEQPLDPKNPAAGSFHQRVFLSHQDFNNPVVFETEGYNAEISMTTSPQSEITERYQANRISVEHRYSGLSIPSPRDWRYLTCENAAADLHAVRKALGTEYTGKWIARGASKSGTNAMSYMMYYPNDLTAAVAYVAPICNSIADPRFITHMLNVATPEMRKRILDFQREMLIRRNRIQPIFFTEPSRPTHAKEYMSNDQQYEQIVVNLPHKVWQYGWPIDEIPAFNATDDEFLDYLIDQKIFGSRTPKNRTSKSRINDNYGKDDGYDIFIEDYLLGINDNSTRANVKPDLSSTHYYVQALIELGSYAHNIKPLEDLIPNHESWSKNLIARFVVPADAANIQFSDKLHDQMNRWLQSSDPRLICVYGEYDHWTAAAPDRAYFAGKNNMSIYIEKGGSHSAKIERLSPTDKQQAWAKLDSWVK